MGFGFAVLVGTMVGVTTAGVEVEGGDDVCNVSGPEVGERLHALRASTRARAIRYNRNLVARI